MSSDAPFVIEVVDGTSALGAFASDWSTLVDRAAMSSPFLTWEWVSTWWDVFGEGRRLHVIAVRTPHGRLVGLAPLMIGRGDGRLSRHLRQLMFLGQQGDTHAEHLDVLAERGREEEVAAALVGAMLRSEGEAWDRVHLERLPVDSPNLPFLSAAFAAEGRSPGRHHEQPSPYVQLPASYEDLLGARSRNFRRQLRNAENRLARRGEGRVRVVGEDLDLDEGFEHLVRLHRARWGPDDGSFRTDAYLRFHRVLARRFAAQGKLLLAVLEVNGEAVAARYDFVHDGRLWCFQGGWLPAWQQMRVGTVLTAAVLRWGIERGALARYELLSGEDEYKRRWADGERSLVDLALPGRTLRTRGYGLLRRLAGRPDPS